MSIRHILPSQRVKLSMDGKGRTTDNTFIERLFRSVKHEKMYINPLPYKQIEESMYYYNNERSHSSIDISVPLT